MDRAVGGSAVLATPASFPVRPSALYDVFCAIKGDDSGAGALQFAINWYRANGTLSSLTGAVAPADGLAVPGTTYVKYNTGFGTTWAEVGGTIAAPAEAAWAAIVVFNMGGTGATEFYVDAFSVRRSVLGAPVVLDSTTLTSQLRSQFQDQIPLTGYVNSAWDGVSTPVDNHDVLATVLTRGKGMILPYGKMYVASAIPTITGKPVSLKGAGRGSQLVFGAGAGGLDFGPGDYSRYIEICDLEVTTLGQEAAVAIRISYAEIDPRRTRVNIRNVRLGGQDQRYNGWRIGLDLDSVC